MRAQGFEHLNRLDYEAASSAFRQAAPYFARTHATEAAQWLVSKGWNVILAPGEADLQLLALHTSGYVQAIVTEDSDLVLLGADVIVRGAQSDTHANIYRRSKLVDTAIGAAQDLDLLLILMMVKSDWGAPFGIVTIGRAIQQAPKYGSLAELLDAAERVGAGREAEEKYLAICATLVWDPQRLIVHHSFWGFRQCFPLPTSKPSQWPSLPDPLKAANHIHPRATDRVGDPYTCAELCGSFYYMAFECGRNGHGHAINWYRTAKRFEVESAARIVDDDLFAELAFQHKTATAVQDILAVGRFTCSRGSAYNFSRR